jgi:exodeoxyribonuclease VII small subunit
MAKSLTVDKLLETADAKADLTDLEFEAGIKLLEDLVSKVEVGDLPLQKSVVSYEKGLELIKHLRGLLKTAEQKLKVLQAGSDDKLLEVAEVDAREVE